MAEDFGQRLPYLLRRVNQALSQRLDEDLHEFGLTQSQLSALAQLDIEHPAGLSGATLSTRSGVTPQSMSTAIAGLLHRGLITRTPHPRHGRILECRITPTGTELLAQVQRATRESGRYEAGLSHMQQDDLRVLLTHMMRSLGLYLPNPNEPRRPGCSSEEAGSGSVMTGDDR